MSDSVDDLTTIQLQCSVDGRTSVLTTGREFREHMQSQHQMIQCRSFEKCFQSSSGLHKHKQSFYRSKGQIVASFDKKFFYQTYEKYIEGHQVQRQAIGCYCGQTLASRCRRLAATSSKTCPQKLLTLRL